MTCPPLKNYRDWHTSAVTSRGLVLVGGGWSKTTTELVTMEGESKEDFSLSHERMEHCSIQVRLDAYILFISYGITNILTK